MMVDTALRQDLNLKSIYHATTRQLDIVLYIEFIYCGRIKISTAEGIEPAIYEFDPSTLTLELLGFPYSAIHTTYLLWRMNAL